MATDIHPRPQTAAWSGTGGFRTLSVPPSPTCFPKSRCLECDLIVVADVRGQPTLGRASRGYAVWKLGNARSSPILSRTSQRPGAPPEVDLNEVEQYELINEWRGNRWLA
jgi:hypothetical protein